MSKKKKKAAAPKLPKRSEIVEQCVIYVQQVAAWDAGFRVDLSGEQDYAGKGRHLKKANRALFNLIALSPHLKAGVPP